MSEASFDMVLQELRATAPSAPELLRDRVRALPAAGPRRSLRLRPALAAAVAIALALGVGAAVIGGLSQGEEAPARSSLEEQARDNGMYSGTRPATPDGGGATLAPLAPTLTAKSRLQRQDIFIELRVKDLSSSTQSAVRTTRRLGGYVAAAHYATEPSAGDSRLELRVPIQNVQKAIARFTELGMLLSQQISVADLQAGLDRLNARIDEARRAGDTQLFARLRRSRTALAREGAYAKVSLQLTTRRPAEKQVEPGRFDRFWGDAGNILGKEAIAVLYALVIVGPFAILAALAFFAERTRRRRADHRLLEETG
jgi:hypothetical protein